MRINRSNRRRLNSSVSDNFGMYFSYPIIDYPAFDEETDARAAIKYINNLLEEKSTQVTNIEREGSYYRVSVQFDIDEAIGYQAWLDGELAFEERATNAIIGNTLKNWGTIKNRLNSNRRRLNSSVNESADCYVIIAKGVPYVTTNWDDAEDFIVDWLQQTDNYKTGTKVSNAQLQKVLDHKHPDIDVEPAERIGF